MNRTISLPEYPLKKAGGVGRSRTLVRAEEFLSPKLSEQFAGLEHLKQRAERASAGTFRTALLQIPDVEPEEYDRF